MKLVYNGIDERFAGFQKNFFLFKNYARDTARLKRQSSRPTEPTEEARHGTITGSSPPVFPILPCYSLDGLHLEPIDGKIKTQYDLLRFLELDASLRRPPTMPVSLIAECVQLQIQAVKHLQVMYWAIKSCADAETDLTARHHQALYHTINRKVRAAAGISADKEDSIHSASLRSARQVGAMLSGSTVAPEPLAGAPTPVKLTSPPRPSAGAVAPAPDGFDGLFDLSSATAKKRTPEISIPPLSQNNSISDMQLSPPPSANAPASILLRMENSFVKVGHYVSLVVTFLQMSLHNMDQWKEASAVHNADYSPTHNSVCNINQINKTRVAQHADFLLRSMSTDAFHETDVNMLTKLETQQIIALFSGFQTIVEQLLGEVVDSVATTVVLNGVSVRTSRQNKEVKIVNAMIASTLDLLRALKGLAATMSKMQAHRDIRITQTGDKFI
jgi:hypothetical protein